jgi:hypothetical protein
VLSLPTWRTTPQVQRSDGHEQRTIPRTPWSASPRAGGVTRPRAVNSGADGTAILERMRHAAEQLDRLEHQAEALLGAWSVQAHVLTDIIDLQDRLRAGNAVAPQASDMSRSSDSPAWESCRTALILPEERVAAMWGRAAQWHVHKGGRFQTVGSTLLLWSGARQGAPAPGARSRIMAFAVAERNSSSPGVATITRLAWRRGLGGSASVMWHALELLAGGPLVGPV